jgi:hypothetical protein
MTVAELIRELDTFQPDSTVLMAIAQGAGDWRTATPAVLYWDTDAHKVIVEGTE